MRRASHRPAGFTLLDLLLLVVLLVLLAGAALPAAVSRRRENDNRMRCANNLRQVGQAIQMYMNENKGKYPRTRYDPARADKPTAYTRPGAKDPFAADGPEANDVTAGLFLLLRTQELPSDAMVCPAARGRKWSGEVQEASNFLNRRQLSYSYANPYPSDAASGAGYKLTFALTSDFAIAADMNSGDEALLKINSASARPQILKGNSLNHDQEGQNVLYADGHVEFQNVPFCGERNEKDNIASRDNIYTYGPSGKDRGGAGIVGSPTGPK